MKNLQEQLTCLRGVGIFSATPEDVLVEVADALTSVEAAAGKTIFAKGETGDSLYIIAEGRVGIFDGTLLLNYLDAGDVFGEMAVLDAQARSAAAVADSDCRLYRLDQRDFRRLLSERWDVAEGVIAVLCWRLRGNLSSRAEDHEYLRLVAILTSAAQDLEAGTFHAEALDEVTRRTDPLGRLARVFQQMGREVEAREKALKQQVQELRIEIDHALQARQVAEIVNSDYFQGLQQQARAIRSTWQSGERETTAAESVPPEESGDHRTTQ